MRCIFLFFNIPLVDIVVCGSSLCLFSRDAVPIQSDADATPRVFFQFIPLFFFSFFFKDFLDNMISPCLSTGGSGFRDGLKEQFVSVDVTPSHLFLIFFFFFSFLPLTKFSCCSTVLCATGELLQY